MKKLIALCVLAAPMFAADGQLTPAERSYLVDRLEETKANYIAAISGLSEAQWKFKPAPEVWSVQECAEHLILAEDFIFTGAQAILKSPAVERPAKSTPETDRQLFAGVLDRSQKAKAPEPIVPAGKYSTPADAVAEFTKRRDRTIAFVKATSDPLRLHVGASPAGPLDAYQFLILLASHSGRHTLQIKEVESNAAFPKNAQAFLVTFTLAKGTIDQFTADQIAILQQHGMGVKKAVDRGLIRWGGRVDHPKQPRGVAVFTALSDKDVRDFAENDPAVKAGLFHYTIEPFTDISR